MGPLDTSMPATQAKPRNKKRIALIAGVGALVALPILQSTFAANVTVNGGAIEFGQGVSAVTACDPAVTITPAAAFVNTPDPGKFVLDTITIQSADALHFSDACIDKTIKVVTRKSNGDAIRIYSFIPRVSDGTNYSLDAVSADMSALSSTITQDVVTIVPATSDDTALIAKITIETN